MFAQPNSNVDSYRSIGLLCCDTISQIAFAPLDIIYLGSILIPVETFILGVIVIEMIKYQKSRRDASNRECPR